MMGFGGTPASRPLPAPPLPLPLQEVEWWSPRAAPAGDAPRAPINPPPPPPPARATTGAAGGVEGSGATAPHVVPVRCAKAPLCKSCRGHRGVRHCCSRHHEGHPWLLPAVGGARQRTLPGEGAMMRKWPCRGRAPTWRPQGGLGARVRATGGQRGKIPHCVALVLPSRRDPRGGPGAVWVGGRP